MKKVLIPLMLLLSVPLPASVYAYLSLSYGVSYDTNVFSDPLPDWDLDDMNFQYEKRVSNEVSISSDIFFDSGPAGLSLWFNMGFPFSVERAEYDGSDYTWSSVSDALPSISFAVGPTFRYNIGSIMDLFLSLRLGFGSYDFFDTGMTLNIVVDGGVRFFPTDRIIISLGGIYDARIMKYLNDESAIYQAGYIMLGIGGYVSVGVRVGDK